MTSLPFSILDAYAVAYFTVLGPCFASVGGLIARTNAYFDPHKHYHHDINTDINMIWTYLVVNFVVCLYMGCFLDKSWRSAR